MSIQSQINKSIGSISSVIDNSIKSSESIAKEEEKKANDIFNNNLSNTNAELLSEYEKLSKQNARLSKNKYDASLLLASNMSKKSKIMTQLKLNYMNEVGNVIKKRMDILANQMKTNNKRYKK